MTQTFEFSCPRTFYGNQVELIASFLDGIKFQVFDSGSEQTPFLSGDQTLLWFAKAIRGARFDLNEVNHATFLGNYVDFPLPNPEITLKYFVTMGPKKFNRSFFTPSSDARDHLSPLLKISENPAVHIDPRLVIIERQVDHEAICIFSRIVR
jgi:hypothetical protein